MKTILAALWRQLAGCGDFANVIALESCAYKEKSCQQINRLLIISCQVSKLSSRMVAIDLSKYSTVMNQVCIISCCLVRLAGHFERSADGRKTQKDRVTISACANASGDMKLPLVLIGKSKNPRCFKHITRDQLPVTYYNQSNAWMNTEIFSEWFHHKFVPIVQEKLRERFR